MSKTKQKTEANTEKAKAPRRKRAADGSLRGRPALFGKREVLAARIPVRVVKDVKKAAEDAGQTLTEWVEAAVTAKLAEK